MTELDRSVFNAKPPASLPDLQRLDGCDYAQAEKALLDLGYKRYPEDCADSQVFYSPDNTHMIKLSADTELAAGCAAMCMKAANKYLPQIFDQRTLSPEVHITALEPLKKRQDMGEGYTIDGTIRAFSTFITGNQQTATKDQGAKGDHEVVHALLYAQDKEFVEAAKRLMDYVDRALRQPRNQYPVYNDSRKAIWFRESEGTSPTMIFFESMTLTDDLAAIEKQITVFKQRIEKELPLKAKEFGTDQNPDSPEPPQA
ncbi:MAG: hypothetical protein H6867_01470 [Rhodospirillales bacterium]|nr:hypothetical protein [Rhodospirillales bacterium]MCB9997186.1 hypothetical protein [Rhodospirillales bacterium]